MPVLRLLVTVLALFPLTSAHAADRPIMSQLEVGQLWEYRHAYSDAEPLVSIGRIEEFGVLGTIVHVSIYDVPVVNPVSGELQPILIGHMPFMADAIEASLTQLVGTRPPSEEFDGGYATWKEASGGVFSLTIDEAVTSMVSMIE